jgi:hypothetical protein
MSCVRVSSMSLSDHRRGRLVIAVLGFRTTSPGSLGFMLCLVLGSAVGHFQIIDDVSSYSVGVNVKERQFVGERGTGGRQ